MCLCPPCDQPGTETGGSITQGGRSALYKEVKTANLARKQMRYRAPGLKQHRQLLFDLTGRQAK